MRGHAVAWGGSRRKQQQQRIENRCTGLLRLKLVLNVFMLVQSLDSIHHHPFIRVGKSRLEKNLESPSESPLPDLGEWKINSFIGQGNLSGHYAISTMRDPQTVTTRSK